MLRLGICKFKYEPGLLKVWLRWESYRGCNKPVEITGKSDYCEEHGCRVCGYVNLKGEHQNPPKEFLKLNFGKKEGVCSEKCQKRGETDHLWEERNKKTRERADLWIKITELNEKLDTEIKNIFLPLYNVVGGNSINNLKGQLINKEIDTQQFAETCQKIIDSYSLDNEEKGGWKNIYQTNNSADLKEKLLGLAQQEGDYLVSLAKKYKELQEQKNTPECKKCKLRREQPNTWPVGCEGWCKECVEQKQREKQIPDNNSDYRPPINDTKFPSSNENNPPVDSDKYDHSSSNSDNSSSQTGGHDKREREKATHGGNLPLPGKQNNLQPEVKKADYTPIYLVSGTIGIAIVAAGTGLVIAKKKRKNNCRYQK